MFSEDYLIMFYSNLFEIQYLIFLYNLSWMPILFSKVAKKVYAFALRPIFLTFWINSLEGFLLLGGV